MLAQLRRVPAEPGGVLDQPTGPRTVRSGPSVGCSVVWKKPTAFRCGSSEMDSRVCSGVAGISAFSNAPSHSAVVLAASCSRTKAYV
ncbi:hypothetical protein SALBM311S_07101 [Streptomyces alboniger]